MTKELSEGWTVKDVVTGAMGSSSSGSLKNTISDALRSSLSGPIAQPSDAMAAIPS